MNKLNYDRLGWLVIWLAAAACSSWTAFTFDPGLMSYDSLIQYRQMRGDLGLNNAHPAIMVYAWRTLDRIFGYPGVLLTAHQVFYWGVVAFFACVVTPKLSLRLVFFFVIGLAPPLYLTSLHVWKDVGMMNALALGSVACLAYIQWRGWGWLVLAIVSISYGVAVRINGFIPAVILVLFICFLMARRPDQSKTKTSAITLAYAGMLLVAQAGAMKIVNLDVARSYGLGTLLVWDIASISIEVDKDLVPSYLPRAVTHDFIADLSKANSAEANYPVYAVVSPYPPKKYEKRLLRDWLAVVTDHPVAYLRHRTHVFLVLMGLHGDNIYYPYHPGIDENKMGLRFTHLADHEVLAYFGWFDRMKDTVLYRPWVYCLLSIGVILVGGWRLAHRRGRALYNAFALIVSASGLVSLASLFFVATAADYRYITWTIFASLISVCALLVEVAWRVLPSVVNPSGEVARR